jgi:hypothetical protein
MQVTQAIQFYAVMALVMLAYGFILREMGK